MAVLIAIGSIALVVTLACILNLRGAPYPDSELLQAAAAGNTHRIQTLVRAGASVSESNENGETALFRASQFKRKETFEELLRLGGDILAEDNLGEGVLVRAVRGGDVDWVKYLVAKGAARKFLKVRRVNSDRVPLHWAAGVGDDDMVRALLSAGISPALLDRDGMKAVDWARRAHRSSTVRILQDAEKAHD